MIELSTNLSSDLDFGFSTIENLFTNGFTDLYSVVKPIVSIAEGASCLLYTSPSPRDS